MEELIETKIERVRYLKKFETLSVYNTITEITFANEGDESVDIIKYDLHEYKPFLKISDSNSEFLEFSGAQEAGHGSYPAHLINIYLPEDRELKPNCRRTITFQSYSSSLPEIKVVEYENPTYVIFYFDIIDQVNSYIIFEAAKHFEFCNYIDLIDQNGLNVDDGELATFVSEKVIAHSKIGNRMYFAFKGDTSKRTLRIIHRHTIPARLLDWIRVGLGLGVLSAILLLVGLIYSFNNNSLDSLSLFITYPALVITTLVVIKGWLFLKDLDSDLEGYNKKYLRLVIILGIEIALAFAISVVC